MEITSKEKRASNFRWPTLLAITTLALATVAAYTAYRLGVPGTARGRPPSAASSLCPSAAALNFGVFPFGQHPTVRFVLTNTAAWPIKIMHLVPSCDCISATCVSRTLAAGGDTALEIAYRGFPGLDGPFSKAVSVVYRLGSGQARSLRLVVYGDLTPKGPFVVYPTRIDIGRVGRGTAAQAVIYFRGQRNLLKSLPKAINVAAGKTRNIVLRKIGISRTLIDRALAIKIQVPDTTSPGQFKSVLKISSPGFGPVVVRVEGRVVGR